MQNEILSPVVDSVSLSKLTNELFVPDPTHFNPIDLCLHWLVYKLDRYQNAVSSKGAKKNSRNNVSWNIS